MNVVHMEEDQKVVMSKELAGSAEIDFDSEVKVNIASYLGERKKEVMSDKKNILGGKMILCPPDNLRKKIFDLLGQLAIIEEKEVALRKF